MSSFFLCYWNKKSNYFFPFPLTSYQINWFLPCYRNKIKTNHQPTHPHVSCKSLFEKKTIISHIISPVNQGQSISHSISKQQLINKATSCSTKQSWFGLVTMAAAKWAANTTRPSYWMSKFNHTVFYPQSWFYRWQRFEEVNNHTRTECLRNIMIYLLFIVFFRSKARSFS
jgi:hypothetical protein